MDKEYCDSVKCKIERKERKPNLKILSNMFEIKKTKKCPKGFKICRCNNKPKPLKDVINCKKTIRYNKRFIPKKYRNKKKK